MAGAIMDSYKTVLAKIYSQFAEQQRIIVAVLQL